MKQNQPCYCGSGRRFKHCHGAPVRRPRMFPQPHESDEIHEFRRLRQQGLGRPIIAECREHATFVTVGKRKLAGRWITFHEFLLDFVKAYFGKEWLLAERQKDSGSRHVVLSWMAGTRRVFEADKPSVEAVFNTPATGAVNALLSLAYDLYTIEHNIESAQDEVGSTRTRQRLSNAREFLSAWYEVRIAAIFIRAGFALQWEDETDWSKTHGEFVATFKNTGKKFWVECKMRQGAEKTGPARSFGKFVSLVGKALSDKATDLERIIFVDLNTVAKVRHEADESDWRDRAVDRLRIFETSPYAKPLPPALVVVTNFQDHNTPEEAGTGHGAAVEGFKMDAFRLGQRISLREAIQHRERYWEMECLLKSLVEHSEVPESLDGKILALQQTPGRLVIGNAYPIGEDGKTGVLESACVMESERIAAAVFHMSDGTRQMANIPLSELEMLAWSRHPETFFGIMGDSPKPVTNVRDLYDFFLKTCSETSRETLLSFLESKIPEAVMASMTTAELASRYCEGLAIGAAASSDGFLLPEWAKRARPVPKVQGSGR